MKPVFEKMYYDDFPKRRKELDQIKARIAGYGDLQSQSTTTHLIRPTPVQGKAVQKTNNG